MPTPQRAARPPTFHAMRRRAVASDMRVCGGALAGGALAGVGAGAVVAGEEAGHRTAGGALARLGVPVAAVAMGTMGEGGRRAGRLT